LKLETIVDGHVMQSGTTAEMVFGIKRNFRARASLRSGQARKSRAD
jgi:2-keto-4-pentenoate hydratase/2-oxohepta-3-ene-1,7-dioic acid hydratase in catechol pathway